MPIIRCKTCGRTYSYEKQGMCPKCGAYNRPPRRERIDPDGSIHYLDDRSAITGAVPNHPRDKVCFEEKVCYEEQAKKPSAASAVRSAAEHFSQMPKKKRESAAASLVGAVLALIFAISGIRSCQADLASRSTIVKQFYATPEPDYPLYEAEADSVLTYEYRSDDWPNYDGSGYCHPGQRFELMGMWPYVSSLSVEDDVLIATVQYFPDDAIAPDLVVTLDDNSTITIPCFDAEYPFTYDLSLLSEEERYRAVLYTLDFPDAYHAGGITAPTGDVIRVDVTDPLLWTVI
mgnify:FL=1